MNLPQEITLKPYPFRQNLEKELDKLNPEVKMVVKGSGRVFAQDRQVAQYSYMNNSFNLADEVTTYRIDT